MGTARTLKRLVPAVCLTGLLLGAGCEEQPPAAARLEVVAVPAEVADARLVERPMYGAVPGVIAPRRFAPISARVVATVTAVLVREGDQVVAGQELMRLDDRDPVARGDRAGAAIREAEEGVAAAERAAQAASRAVEAAAAAAGIAGVTRHRLDALEAKGAIPAQTRDEARSRETEARAQLARAREERGAAELRSAQARSRVEQARAEAAGVRVARSDTTLVAPFAGLVASRPPDPGTLATPAGVLLRLEDGRRIEAQVPGGWLPSVQLGARVPVELDAPAERVTGVVEEIAAAADPVARTVLVRVGLPAGLRRRSGGFGRVLFALGTRSVIEVPADCISTNGQLESVFVVSSSGIARLRLVATGEAREEGVEILAGLADGERVVRHPPTQLADGLAVAVQP